MSIAHQYTRSFSNWSARKQLLPLLSLFSVLLSGCFEEDERVEPHVPGDEISYEFQSSMYTHQSHFNFSTNSVQAENENGIWVIKFGAQEKDWHIRINSSDTWVVYPSGTSDENSIPEKPPTEDLVFDHSSGDPDSSAFAGWVSFSGEDTIYSEDIYLIGKYDGITFRARFAAQFLYIDGLEYLFRLKDWPTGEWKEHSILKSDLYNYIYFNTEDSNTVPGIEPEKNSWDLLFTLYGSILFTNDGAPIPYYVRGVLLNRYMTRVAIDSTSNFHDINFDNIDDYQFSTQQDIIGYEWKAVKVDFVSGTAVYTIRPGITYIIMDTEGFFYKMRFISYYNSQGEKGFPVIEHARL